MFHKKTYSGLLPNYFSFVPLSCKLGLGRTLVGRTFKINNIWAGFHLDINDLANKEFVPFQRYRECCKKFLNSYFTPDSFQSVARKNNCLNFKLPYIGPFSITTQRRIKKLVSTFRNDLDIKLLLTPVKIRSWFGAKEGSYSCGFTIASNL